MAGYTDSSVHSRLLALASLSMGFSMIGSVFGFYYVKCFLNYYHIQESWFQIAQVLYLVWNTVNDPLFAYFQDSTSFKCTRTRRESVLYASPFFALSFLVPWFPWGNPETMQAWVTGIHLITALCFWDTMFTYVGLAACCLYTEISLDYSNRVKALRYGQTGSLIGSLSVFFVQYMSDGLENFHHFQVTCVLIAVISCLLMRYCGKHARTERELKGDSCAENSSGERLQTLSYFTLTKQLVTNRDLLAFVVTNFFQEFHRTYLNNFLAIFCDQLIPKGAFPDIVRSAFYGGSFLVSKIISLLGIDIVHQYGYFKIMRYSFALKIAMGSILFMLRTTNHWILILYLLVDGCTTDGIYCFFNLPLSDITDNDAKKYNRRHPITSMIYGTNALFVKPALSLCPMFVVAILNRHGYEQLKENTLAPDQRNSLHTLMFDILCWFPIILGCIQTVSWSFYTIRNTNLTDRAVLVLGDQAQLVGV